MTTKFQSAYLALFQIWLEVKMWRRTPSFRDNLFYCVVAALTSLTLSVAIVGGFYYASVVSYRVLITSIVASVGLTVWYMPLYLRHRNRADFTPEQQNSIEKEIGSKKDQMTAKIIRQNKEVLDAFVPRANSIVSSTQPKKLTHKI